MTNVANNAVVQFSFSIFGVPGFKSAVAGDASVRKRMSAALNYIDRENSAKLKELLSKDKKNFTPMDFNVEKRLTAVGEIIVNIKDVLKRALPDDDLPLKFVENIATFTTEEFLEKGGDTYDGNVELFTTKLSEIEENAEIYFANRRRAREEGAAPPQSFVMYVPNLYECRNGIFGKDKFHIILSLDTIRQLDPNGSVVEAVKLMCRQHITSVKSFQLSNFLRDVKNRDKIKQQILEMDKLYDLVDEVNVYHLSRLFADRTPAVLRSQGKADDTMPKVSRVMQGESRELLQNYVMNLCSPMVQSASTEQELPGA